MDDSLKIETEKLVRSWMQHEPDHLAAYLVSGVEDPRINLQSILTRHFLIRELFPEHFEKLMEEECRFGATLNILYTLGSSLGEPEVKASVLHALQQGSDNAEGIPIAQFLGGSFRSLPVINDSLSVPNYLEELLTTSASEATGQIDGRILNCFQELWRAQLRPLSQDRRNRPSVLEPACGSANEYRFLNSYEIARFLDYTGFDLCEKNVANARRVFPEIKFECGNVFEISAADQSFDLCFLHDLLEHLSVEGLERAVGELCRVTRRALCIGFFQMHEGPEHIVRQVEEYHWNTLSMNRVRDLFRRQGFQSQVIHIGTFLRESFGCDYTYNPDAYTLILTRVGIASQTAQQTI
jgi:SAM-dependent methyltransferase